MSEDGVIELEAPSFPQWKVTFCVYVDACGACIKCVCSLGYLSCFTEAIRHLKTDAEWAGILAKVREEEEEPLPSYIFKVKAEA